MNALLERTKKVYSEYPRAFWVYNLIVFIDRLGGFMLYPFFALYLTKKFEIGMSTVGILFAVFSVSGMVGSALGGALTDRMGRKVVITFSLVLSSLSALGMGFAPTLGIFIAVVAIVGTLSSIGHPAHEAVVADLLPQEKRAEGYGIIRVVFNVAVIIAPPIAGLLIANSYLTLFIVDAVISVIAATIVIFALPETKPKAHENAKPENDEANLRGLRARVQRHTICGIHCCHCDDDSRVYEHELNAGRFPARSTRTASIKLWLTAQSQRRHRCPLPILGCAQA